MKWVLDAAGTCENCHDSPLECIHLIGEGDAYVTTLCAGCLIRMADHLTGFNLIPVYQNLLVMRALKVPRAAKKPSREHSPFEVIDGQEQTDVAE